jgi:hypothetical protein
MSVEIQKRLALQLFAYAREAERSVDFACHGPEQWASLRDYYGGEKREALRELLKQIEPFIPPYPPLLDRSQFYASDFLWLLRRPFIRLANRKRLDWQFAPREIVFIHQIFNYLLDLLAAEPAPPAQTLVNLRMDFSTCEDIIDTRLHGVPELGRALKVEHFCQNERGEYVKIKDLLEIETPGSEKFDDKALKANGRRAANSTNRVA